MSDNNEAIRGYFEREDVLEHYARATANVGLWRSEEVVLKRLFATTERILEVGCGTGRIAFGMHEIGYVHVLGIDYSRAMVKRARKLATLLEYPVSFQVGDATALKFENELFDGAVFGFNGLMQIPGREQRRKALREIRRVIRTGGYFVFTTHDRDHYSVGKFWQEAASRWEKGERPEGLSEFGDRWVEAEIGAHFIHVPTRAEVMEDLTETGWQYVEDAMRSEIANEPQEVREFADDCRFWVVRRG